MSSSPGETAFGYQVRVARALSPVHTKHLHTLQVIVRRARRCVRILRAERTRDRARIARAQTHLASLDQVLRAQDLTSTARFHLVCARNALAGHHD